MEKKYISEITSCCNNPFLAEALAFSDYEQAMEIINDIASDRGVFIKVNDENFVSDLLLKALDENDIVLMEDIIKLCERQTIFNLIINMIDSTDLVEAY